MLEPEVVETPDGPFRPERFTWGEDDILEIVKDDESEDDIDEET